MSDLNVKYLTNASGLEKGFPDRKKLVWQIVKKVGTKPDG
jgi:hypothetical protein